MQRSQKQESRLRGVPTDASIHDVGEGNRNSALHASGCVACSACSTEYITKYPSRNHCDPSRDRIHTSLLSDADLHW